MVSAADMQALGATMAKSHAHCPAAPPEGPLGLPETVCQPVLDNFTSLRRDCDDPDLLQKLAGLEQFNANETRRLKVVFRQRLDNARIRECHGDLHLANLVRIDDQIIAFDCLEFSPALRWIDVISEVAFLVMDTLAHDKTELAYAFLNRYLEISGDYSGVSLLPFYLVYRCLVRAKVAAVRHRQSAEASDLNVVRRYVDLAAELTRPEKTPILIITHGLSGSGKTWLTNQLLLHIPAIRVRSDLERKRLHGLTDLESSRSSLADGIYTAASSAATYVRLADVAETCLSAGFSTIVDATFLQHEQRDQFRVLARKQRLPFAILDCEAGPETLRRRIQDRSAAARDASEADLAVLEYQLQTRQMITDREQQKVIHCDTEQRIDVGPLLSRIRARQSQATP
jgi:predicted kinase